MSSSIFLSHSKVDKEFARILANDLKKAGIKVWLDEAEIKIGDSILGKLEDAIEGSEYLAILLSPDSVKSKWVQAELKVAMHREISGDNLTVLPLLIRDCEIPLFLRNKLFGDFRDPFSYTKNLLRLTEELSGETHKLSIVAVLLRSIFFEIILIIRDVILINLISGLIGFILGLAGITWWEGVAPFAQLLYLSIGIFIVGTITKKNLWSHLLLVAFSSWLINGLYLIPKYGIPAWLLNFFGMGGVMLIGGLILMLFKAFKATSRIFQSR